MTQAKLAGQAPAAPTPPPAPFIVSSGVLTARDVAAMRSRGDALSDQIRSAANRRREVREAFKTATGADKAGLEQRLSVLDNRIAGLETDIAENGKQLASLDAQRAIANTPPPSARADRMNKFADNMVPVMVVFTIFVLFPLSMGVLRFLWKKSTTPPAQRVNHENADRLERIEHAVDAIALEVERVSEGQRFVTRLLAEGQQPAALGTAQRTGDRVGNS